MLTFNKRFTFLICSICFLMIGNVIAEKEPVKIKIIDIGIKDNVYTPYYEIQTEQDHERAAAAKWIRLGVEYETDAAWIDDIVIKHYLLCQTDSNGGIPVFLKVDVHYINIKPGRHFSYVYLHPSYVEHYQIDSDKVDSAVEILVVDEQLVRGADESWAIDGKVVVASSETTRHAKSGWSKDDKFIIHHGHLLNYSETPFWFVNYDFHEVIKHNEYWHENEKK